MDANSTINSTGVEMGIGLGTMQAMRRVFAHEMAQPLSSITGNATAALNASVNCPHATCGNLALLDDIVKDLSRLRSIFHRIHALARDQSTVRELDDVNRIICETLEFAKQDARPRRVVLRRRLGNGLPLLRLDAVQIQQVLLNLLSNAVDSVTESGVSKPAVEIRSHALDGAVEIAVRDNGSGIPDALLPRIANDFLTTKADGNGIGLMLSRAIIERHQGKLTAENNKRRGATFRLILPTGP